MDRVPPDSYPRMSLLDSDKKLDRHLHPQPFSKSIKEEMGKGAPLGSVSSLPQPGQKVPHENSGIVPDNCNGGGGAGSNSYRLGSSGLIMCREFAQDQVQDENFTDLSIICSDGYAQVHRCLLIGSSPLLREMLIDKDILDTSAISLPDVSVRHLMQVLSLLYTGRSVIQEGDEEPVSSLMVMLQLPVEHLYCRSAKESDLKEVVTLRYYTEDMEVEDIPSAQGQEMSEDFNQTVDSQIQPNGMDGELESAPPPLPPLPIMEETLNDEGLEEDNVENEDPVHKNEDTGSATVVDSTTNTSKDRTSQKIDSKRKLVDSDDDDKPENEEDEKDDVPKEGIYHRLRKRPMTMTGAQGLIMKKKAVARLRKKTTVNNKSSQESEPSAPDSQNEQNHEKKGAPDSGESIPIPSCSVLPPGIIQDRERRLSSLSSVSSSTSSSGTTAGSAGAGGASRVFLETKEISGISYNIYGLLDPVKGVQSGKTIAIIASKDKSSTVKRCEGSSGKIS